MLPFIMRINILHREICFEDQVRLANKDIKVSRSNIMNLRGYTKHISFMVYRHVVKGTVYVHWKT